MAVYVVAVYVVSFLANPPSRLSARNVSRLWAQVIVEGLFNWRQ